MDIPNTLQSSKFTKIKNMTREDMEAVKDKIDERFELEEIQKEDLGILDFFIASSSKGQFTGEFNTENQIILKNKDCESFEKVCLVIRTFCERRVKRRMQKNRHDSN